MEAFPAILLLTNDPVLAEAIPPQLRHTGNESCTVVADWAALQQTLRSSPPALALLDCGACAEHLCELTTLRQSHPLMALVGIGEAGNETGQAGLFIPLPLSSFIKRPVAMQVLLRSVEHLCYERILNAGQQVLPLPQGAELHAARKSIHLNDQMLELTDKEVALLLCLYHHRHGWLPRQQLLEDVWGYSDDVTTHTLETHLYRLRGKLREIFGENELITTRQGAYRLELG
jgi:DNA-binding response OmpR family regulator